MASPSNWWRPKCSVPLQEPAASSLQRDALRELLSRLRPVGPEPCHESISVRKDELLVGIHDVEVDGATVSRDREFDLAVDDEAPEWSGTRRRPRLQAPSRPESEQLLESLRLEAARMVQQPLNPAVLEAARQLLDRTALRWPDALQLGAASVAREMFQGTEIVFVSASAQLLKTAEAEGFKVLDPAKEAAEPVG